MPCQANWVKENFYLCVLREYLQDTSYYSCSKSSKNIMVLIVLCLFLTLKTVYKN
jgi:hypothetical protein